MKNDKSLTGKKGFESFRCIIGDHISNIHNWIKIRTCMLLFWEFTKMT